MKRERPKISESEARSAVAGAGTHAGGQCRSDIVITMRRIDRLALDRSVLSEFCARHRIHRLLLFGSVLHGDDRPDSDLDLLVEFEEGARVGLIGLATMQLELSHLLGRNVDLRTPGELSRYFRDRVLSEAEVQYARS